MKTFLQKKLIIALLIAVSFTACEKEDPVTPNGTNNQGNTGNNGSNGGGGNTNNGSAYSFKGNTINAIGGEYLYADDDVLLFVQGADYADYVQFIFPKMMSTIPVGSFSYNADRYDASYDVTKHFWAGAVTDEVNPLGYPINGGNVTISQSGDKYTIAFDITVDDNGTSLPAKGSYTGTLKSR